MSFSGAYLSQLLYCDIGHGEPGRAHTLLGVRWPGLFSPSSPGLSTSACIVGDKLAKTPRKLSKSVSEPVFLSLFHWCSFVPALHYAPSRIRRALFRARADGWGC